MDPSLSIMLFGPNLGCASAGPVPTTAISEKSYGVSPVESVRYCFFPVLHPQHLTIFWLLLVQNFLSSKARDLMNKIHKVFEGLSLSADFSVMSLSIYLSTVEKVRFSKAN